MSNLNLKIDGPTAIIEFDQQDAKVNVLNQQVMKELDAILDELSKEIKGGAVKALLITSKKDVFIAGADIKEIENIRRPQEAKAKAEAGKIILNKLAGLDMVTMAVINGACLGGGLELALACKYRVASFSEGVKMGLPEVKLGIIPGFGGTWRLPRLIGLIRGLDMILTGEAVSGKDALKYGIVDRLFPANRLIDEAVEFAKEISAGKIRVKKKSRKPLLALFLEDAPLGRTILFHQVKKDVLKRTKGFYPAPLEAIKLIQRTYGFGYMESQTIALPAYVRRINWAMAQESEAFSRLAVTDISKNLIKVFYLNEEFRKIPWVDAQVKPAPINKCAVVGAGVMGGGIAQLLGFYDIPTRMKDVNYPSLSTALKVAGELFHYALKKGKLKKPQADFKMGMISPTLTYKGFENAGLVIEAVVEDISVKEKVFKELGQITSSQAILASNTSSLPIIKMAEAAGAPERVVGLHFFNPVHRMPLVEIIRTPVTSEQALATIIAFSRRIGKVVIVVKDAVGFLINRILLNYLNEAGYLLQEGIAIERIDNIARDFGMPVGPLELIDEIGIDVGYKVAKILEEAYGERMRVCEVLTKVKEKGLLGKKAQKGFYIYKGKNKVSHPDIYNIVGRTGQARISNQAVLKRLIYVMVNEAARCLEEGVIDRPESVDIGMIMGTGFPAFRAGLLRYADAVGIDKIVQDLRDFQRDLGALRFHPCTKLESMAQERRNFYGTL